MKKHLTSIPLKLTAILLSYIMVIVLIISIIAVLFMGYNSFYFTSKENVHQNILSEMALSESYSLSRYYDLERNLDYKYKDNNLYYTIEELDGKTVTSNYNGEEILTSGQHYDESYIYTVYIKKEMDKTDEFSIVKELIDVGYALRYWMIVFAVIAVGSIISLLCFLYCSAGHKQGYNEIRLNYLDLIPTDIYAAFTVAAFVLSYLMVCDIYFEGLETIIVWFILGTLLYFLLLGFTMSVATRIKTGTLFKNTVIYKAGKWCLKVFKNIGKSFVYLIKKLPFIWKTVLALAVIVLLEWIYLEFNLYYRRGIVRGFIFFTFITSLAVLYVAITLQNIKQGGEKIARGELDHKIDTKYMVLDFKEFSQNLNSINDGLQIALNEKMKSEIFKTELITNVSHDIKTPLTSIINYVDLLKKEEIQNEDANEYIKVLDRQSGRLKKLVEDLVEASKASTGNLTVNLAPCNIGVLLSQTIGEFDEKFKSSQITPVLKIPKENVIIKADARHLWRVIDNLFNNICKYSQTNTRAYIDVVKQNGKALITFKNISRYELNISSEELMERFVRGDKSRHTEGSGLGLSIAKSLTEIQNGNMQIEVDGDLFKVTLEFDIEVK